MTSWLTGLSKLKKAIFIAMLSLGALSFCDTSVAQQRALNYNGPGGIGSTVSVASLRIPEKALQHFAKARSLNQRGRLAEAEVESQKAIAADPDFAAAHLLRASVQVQEHNFLDAITSVAEARRIEPGVHWSGVVLAGALNGLRRYTEAKATLAVLQGEESKSWQAAYERARSAVGLEDVPAALRWSEAALVGAPPDFSEAMIVRANCFVLAGRWSEAASQLEAYLQTKGAVQRRGEVLTALEEDKRRAREEELRRVASR